ncbi:MAG: hypothetical protein Q9M36_05070 [Sulfurovum sp.]|nr:hypothetical protein [Sulfurovum sp.]
MKKIFVFGTLWVIMGMTSISADGLKNSLNNIMGEGDSSQMVDLSSLDLNAKPKPVPRVQKKRSAKTVIATVNNAKILKKDADGYLLGRTKGKIDNFDILPAAQQKRLIYEMALPILAFAAAKKELTEVEKETVMARVWMQKEAREIKVTVAEVQVVYEQLKQQAIDNNDTREIPKFEAIQDKLHIQMVEKQMMDSLTKDMNITIASTDKTVAKINDIGLSLEEVNKALDILTKGKNTWSALPDDAKKQLIQMMAPSKLIAHASAKSFTKKERKTALSGFWMQKKMSEMKVTDKDIKEAYDKAVANAKKTKNANIPAFDKVKKDFKMRYAQEKVVAGLMKNAKIKVK